MFQPVLVSAIFQILLRISAIPVSACHQVQPSALTVRWEYKFFEAKLKIFQL